MVGGYAIKTSSFEIEEDGVQAETTIYCHGLVGPRLHTRQHLSLRRQLNGVSIVFFKKRPERAPNQMKPSKLYFPEALFIIYLQFAILKLTLFMIFTQVFCEMKLAHIFSQFLNFSIVLKGRCSLTKY